MAAGQGMDTQSLQNPHRQSDQSAFLALTAAHARAKCQARSALRDLARFLRHQV
jgi:hypothetical protein